MAENTIKDVKLKIGTENQFQSKLKDLPINTLVGTTDPIQEGELDTSIITKLNKAENALPKPTNDTTGSAGQVLKKTANGSEWGDAPSGGGKLYNHAISYLITDLSVYINVITSSSTPFTQFSEFKSLVNHKVALVTSPEFCGAVVATIASNKVWIRGGGVSGSDLTTYVTIDKELDSSSFYKDTVTEL